ncbi:MAG: hypothetical protein ACR2KJ_01325 [Jatrophihabitans sp.]
MPSSLAAALTAVSALLVVLVARWGPDWPAQQFRAGLAGHASLHVWNDQWYGGHALPGYSVLYPIVSAVLGARVTGLLAVTAAAWAAGLLLPSDEVARHRRYSIAVAAILSGSLIIGQVPFLLGVALALWALVALSRQRTVVVWVFAAAASLASPLAGVFLLMAVPSLAVRFSWRRALPLSAGLAGSVVAGVVGGAAGPDPYPWQSLIGVLGFSIGSLLVTTRADCMLRRFAAVYAVVGVLAFLTPNPIGGNVDRIGKLIALPLACYLLFNGARRTKLLRGVLVAVAALLWPFVPLTSAIAQGARDPSQNAVYFTQLLSFLDSQNPTSGRLEIPFTRAHWESARVAPHFPLARGWERQTDLKYNSVLYEPLTPNEYLLWLRDSAVSLVALPSVPLDEGGKAEGRLLAHPPPYLRQVWSNQNWTVWTVVGGQPLASGPASITRLGPASFDITFRRAGASLVRIRASNLWHVTAGTGCVDAGSQGWLEVHAPAAGMLTLRAQLNTRLLGASTDCDAD